MTEQQRTGDYWGAGVCAESSLRNGIKLFPKRKKKEVESILNILEAKKSTKGNVHWLIGL